MNIVIIEKNISSKFANKFLESKILNKKNTKIIKLGNQIIENNFGELDLSNLMYKNYKKKKFFLKKQTISFLKKNPEYINYKLFEFNYADEIWQIFFFVNVIKKFKNIKKLFLITKKNNSVLLNALKISFSKKLTIIKSRKYDLISNNFKKKIIFLSNFLNSFVCSILFLFFNKKQHKKSKIIYYANFPNHWDIKKSKYKLLGNSQNKNLFLLSILRNNSNLLSSYKNFFKSLKLNTRNIIFLESLLSPLDILKIYFFSFKKQNNKKIRNYLRGIDLEFAFDEITQNYCLLENTRNLMLLESLEKFYKKYSFKKIVYPFFEFLDGKIISNFFNKKSIITYGYQHAYVSKNLYSRFYDSAEILYKSNNSNFIPKNIFVENAYQVKNFSILKKINKVSIGAMRYSNFDYINCKSNSNYLLLMDLHNKNYLLSEIKNFKTKNIKLFIRPHPIYRDDLKKINFNHNIFLDNSSNITAAIKKNNISKVITTNYTSSFLDILNSNLVIIIINIKNFMRDDEELKKYFPVINNLEEINKNKFKNSVNKPFNFISSYGNKSIVKFNRLIKK